MRNQPPFAVIPAKAGISPPLDGAAPRPSLSLQGERRVPSFRRRPESIRLPSTTDGAAPRLPLSLQGERTPRTRRERVLGPRRASAASPPLPIRGEDAAKRRGEGTADGAAGLCKGLLQGERRVPSFRRRPESIRRHSAIDGATPRLPCPRGPVIPAKAGTYWKSSFPRRRESRPIGRGAPAQPAP